MKKYIIALFLMIFIVPSIALASWWNPFSWKIFQKKQIVPEVQVETQKTPEEKINELQKQLDELKNQKTTPVSTTAAPVIKKEVDKKIIPVVDNLAALKAENQAKVDAEAKIRAEQYAIKQQAQKDAENKQRQAQEQANQKALALQQELAQKRALLAEMKTNCDDPINVLKQQILDIKSKYFSDLENLKNKPGIMTSYQYDSWSIKLLNDANTKIQDLNNQIQQIALQCSIKYGN